MGEQERSAEAKPLAKPAQGVVVSQSRCPYCHDAVEAEASVACQECLGRHHAACWEEAGRCSACQCETRLEVKRPELTLELVQRLLSRQGYSDQEAQQVLRGAGRAVPWPAWLGLFFGSVSGAMGLGFTVAAHNPVYGWDQDLLGGGIGLLAFGVLAYVMVFVLLKLRRP